MISRLGCVMLIDNLLQLIETPLACFPAYAIGYGCDLLSTEIAHSIIDGLFLAGSSPVSSPFRHFCLPCSFSLCRSSWAAKRAAAQLAQMPCEPLLSAFAPHQAQFILAPLEMLLSVWPHVRRYLWLCGIVHASVCNAYRCHFLR